MIPANLDGWLDGRIDFADLRARYRERVASELGARLAWQDVEHARAQCAAALATAEAEKAEAEKALPDLDARVEKLSAQLDEAVAAHNMAMSRGPARLPQDHATTRKRDELLGPFRDARRARYPVAATLRRATAELKRLEQIRARLAMIAAPTSPLLDRLGIAPK